mmetsp:Transcript_10367/g.11801  ORF Transcript_10367/g.11801 Transcript_10367/m.11801 type:complete len:471 (-) Transcript_10367:137-1549(-)
MLLRVAIFSIFVCLALAELQVLSPENLKKFWSNEKPKAAIANFGYVPWGRKLTGIVHVADPYKACEPLKPFKLDKESAEDASRYPILIAERGGCTFNQKAQNAQLIGAKMLIIVDTLDEAVEFTMPIGDGHDSSVHIPTVMVGPRYGSKIKDFINNGENVTVAMNFELPDNKGSTVKLDLWLSGTDERSFKLVQGLKQMIEKIGYDKVIPKPYYAIWYCPYCKELNYKTYENPNCYSGGRYCSPDPDDAGPLNGRDIILEDLRQLCLADLSIESWFQYMSDYKCDYEKERNLTVCFVRAMERVKNWTVENIDQCVKDSFKGDTGNWLLDDNWRLSKQRQMFKRKGIQVWPSVLINDFLYRGNVLPVTNVVEAICEDFSPMPAPCVEILNRKKSDVIFDEPEDVDLFGIVLWITFIAAIFLVLALFFYRRWIRRELMRDLNNQLNARISEYMAMQDEEKHTAKGGALKADA